MLRQLLRASLYCQECVTRRIYLKRTVTSFSIAKCCFNPPAQLCSGYHTQAVLLSEHQSFNDRPAEDVMENPSGGPDPPGFKDLMIVVSSGRITTIANHALALGTKKINEAFYDGRIRVNNARIPKKTVKAFPGDVIDVILDVSDTEVILQRIKVVSDDGLTSKGNEKFLIRRWKKLVLPRIQKTGDE